MTTHVSRRQLLGAIGVAAAAGTVGTAGAMTAHANVAEPAETPFYGVHQSGIITPQQARLHLVALDLATNSRTELAHMLRAWTAAGSRLTAGHPVGAGLIPADHSAPPDDSGEASDLAASRLTITVGFGGGLLDRLGLPRPPALADLPVFSGDALEPPRCGGDLMIQACADDAQVALHAVRTLVRLSGRVARIRWSQLGFVPASAGSGSRQTPRNLFGFKDGTVNAPDSVWVRRGDGPAWMHEGSYLVVRRVAMRLEAWDRSSLAEQERVIGRHKRSGAPLGAATEGAPVLPAALPVGSHVREAHRSQNGGASILRRGYSYVDAGTGHSGEFDAGLCFLAYQRDPRTGFVPIQQRLARHDAMNEYVRHTGSALFAVPPGARPGEYLGQGLFSA